MHKVADEVQAAVGIPLLHIADVAADAVTAAGLQRVALLGTAFTMEQPFYASGCDAAASRSSAAPQDRAEVHRIIYDELCLGVIREESREIFRGMIARLVDAGAKGVILGCTEIELLVSADDSPVPVFATTRLHVEAAVAASLAADRSLPAR